MLTTGCHRSELGQRYSIDEASEWQIFFGNTSLTELCHLVVIYGNVLNETIHNDYISN